MSINLSNVNITIQQFQEIASGKYNAGEVKLTSETSLGKINNHVGYGGTNNDTISHDEVLAIKDAFVRALSKSGVGVNALAEIRRRIGLAPDPLSPKALVERSIRPLSRQQIRSILDEHRDEINLATGAQTVRTHAEIYARHGDEAIARYERTRRAVNIAFMQSRNLDGNRRILDLQRVIAGDIHFCTGEDRTRLISSATPTPRISLKRISRSLRDTFSRIATSATPIPSDAWSRMTGSSTPEQATMSSSFRRAGA